MSDAIWIVAAGLVAAFAVVALLAVSRGARRRRPDDSAAADSGIYFAGTATDFGSGLPGEAQSADESCDTGGWSDGGDTGGGDCGGDGGGGSD